MNDVYHTLPREAVLKKLNVTETKGLTAEEAQTRLIREGKNLLKSSKHRAGLKTIVEQFTNPLAIVLVVAFFATWYLAEHVDALVILAALFVNAIIGFIQEFRASRAFDALVKSQDHRMLTLRDGKKILLSSTDLVAGDIIIVEVGSVVPADCYLLTAVDVTTSEAHLTGESHPIEKHTGVLSPETPIYEQHNMLFMGSPVLSGAGTALVVATGSRARMGEIAKSLDEESGGKTPVEISINRLAQFIAIVVGSIAVLIVLISVVREAPLLEAVLLAVALAVSAVPEGLPAAVTAILAIGMEAILKKKGLVKNLLAAETLGSTSIILTDKTGTLTEGRMQLVSIVTRLEQAEDVSGVDQKTTLSYALHASDAAIISAKQKEIHGRPVERAIASFALDQGIFESVAKDAINRADFLKFASLRRFAAALYKEGDTHTAYISGAPETLLHHATSCLRAGKAVPLTEEDRRYFEDTISELAHEGKRIIGVSYKIQNSDTLDRSNTDSILEGSVFAGLLVLSDPVRSDVPEAIKEVLGAGVRVVVVTGDTPATARAIAHDAGIAPKDARVITGKEIEKMNDAEVYEALMEHFVFARVLPHQKKRLALVLQENGEVVGMTGDGVNDAPALQSANIGIAVGSGSEVAREAADLVLLDNSFSIITTAIREGRRIMDNLKKAVSHLVSTSFHEVFIIVFALIAAMPLPVLPLQILWVNILQGGFLNFAFAFEPPEDEVMKRDPRSHSLRTILTREIRKLILIAGIITGIFSVALYVWLVWRGTPIDEVRTIMFVVLSLDSMLFAISLKQLYAPFWKEELGNNLYLIGAIGISIVGIVATFTINPLREILSLVPLNAFDLLVLLGVGLFNLATIEFAKKFAFRGVLNSVR